MSLIDGDSAESLLIPLIADVGAFDCLISRYIPYRDNKKRERSPWGLIVDILFFFFTSF